MKNLKESLFDSKTQTMESLFDKDLVEKDIFSELKDLGSFFEAADAWNVKQRHHKYEGTYVFKDPQRLNEYVCFVFDFILMNMGQFITKTKPDFDTMLKKLSIIQYVADRYKLDPSEVIKLFKDRGYIKIVKLKDLFNKSLLTPVDKNAAKWTEQSWGYQY